MQKFDLVIKNGNVVIPKAGIKRLDIGVLNKKISTISENIPEQDAFNLIDATDRFVFPGAIDSHFHIGIYRPLSDDAESESTSAASGGITTILSYFRTETNYLNKTGLYKNIFPELLEKSKNSFLTDYSYHIVIMDNEQINEIEWLVREC